MLSSVALQAYRKINMETKYARSKICQKEDICLIKAGTFSYRLSVINTTSD
jgi:hypothetical protein